MERMSAEDDSPCEQFSEGKSKAVVEHPQAQGLFFKALVPILLPLSAQVLFPSPRKEMNKEAQKYNQDR